MRFSTRPRPAFTLLELIVVLSIMALLAAMTVSAVFRLLESSRESNTNTHIRAINVGLEQQWKAAVDRIKTEDPPKPVKDLTMTQLGPTNFVLDQSRAKALHLKLRLRQEFPQNFTEARTGIQVISPADGSSYIYGPKTAYINVIRDASAISLPTEAEGAALLMLIVSQTRAGSSFNAEGAGPTQVIEFDRIPIPPLPPPPPGAKLPLKVYVDAWGRPISFRRAAAETQLDVVTELNLAPFVTPAMMASLNMDPQDPEGRLKLNNWPGKATALGYFATAPLANPFDGLNRGPYIYSGGRDKQFGNDDDLYSFRLQATGKGN